MQFTVTGISRCAGGEHIHVNLTVDSVPYEFSFTKSDIDLAINSLEEGKERVIARLVSAVKEAGATTPAEIAAALVDQTFRV